MPADIGVPQSRRRTDAGRSTAEDLRVCVVGADIAVLTINYRMARPGGEFVMPWEWRKAN